MGRWRGRDRRGGPRRGHEGGPPSQPSRSATIASVPLLRPFRALRYDAASVGDLSAVISPPYDVIDPDLQARLLARHPRNSVRLDLPEGRPGDEPGARYRRAAADFVAWRSDSTLRKDPGPAVYVYEQRYRAADASMAEPERVHRGVFTRLRLEDLGPGGG
ncbi:MAG: DUF1015 family protein, partial [Chloroflexota bacterium]